MEQNNESNRPKAVDGETLRFVVDGQGARLGFMIKRLWIALIIAIALLAATNAFWLYEWTQYDYVSTTEVTQDADGVNIYGDENEVAHIGTKNQADTEPNAQEDITPQKPRG